MLAQASVIAASALAIASAHQQIMREQSTTQQTSSPTSAPTSQYRFTYLDAWTVGVFVAVLLLNFALVFKLGKAHVHQELNRESAEAKNTEGKKESKAGSKEENKNESKTIDAVSQKSEAKQSLERTKSVDVENSNESMVVYSFNDNPQERNVLRVSSDLTIQVKCRVVDEHRYGLYLHNAVIDLCAKVLSRMPIEEPTESQIFDAVLHVRQLCFAKHLTDNTSHGTGNMAFPDDTQVSVNVQQHVLNITAVITLDCLTKASEHILHAPNRISYLFNTYVASHYKHTGNVVTLSFPRMDELLRGHEQLASADLSQQKTENEITIYDIDTYSSLEHILVPQTGRQYLIPPKRKLRLITAVSTTLLKLGFYWPVLQLKLFVLFVSLYVKFHQSANKLLHYDSLISLCFHGGLLLGHLWLMQGWTSREWRVSLFGSSAPFSQIWKSQKMWCTTILSYFIQMSGEIFILACTSTGWPNSPAALLVIRAVTYAAGNLMQLIMSAYERHQRPFTMAISEGAFSLIGILFPTALLLYLLESALYTLLDNIQTGSLCHPAKRFDEDGFAAYINGCNFLQVFSFLIFLTDVYPVYTAVLSAFGVIAGFWRRFPMPQHLTPHGLKCMSRKMFPLTSILDVPTLEQLESTSRILINGMTKLRKRDLIGNTTFTEFEEAITQWIDGERTNSQLPDREAIPFDIRSLYTLELRNVFWHLMTHVQQEMTPCRPSWVNLPSITHVLPVCGEAVLFSYADLLRTEDPQNQVKALVYNNPLEFLYFLERMNDLGFMKCASEEDKNVIKKRAINGDPNWVRDYVVKDHQQAFEIELCMWTSLRGQTVARTLMGMCQYSFFLMDLLQGDGIEDEETRKQLVAKKCQVLVCDQKLSEKAENKKVLERVLEQIRPAVDVEVCFDYDDSKQGYLTEDVRRLCPGARYASGLMRWNSRSCKLELVHVLPRTYPLRVGCDAENMTQGKAGNQRQGMLYARGDVIQAIDANQCWYYLESLFVPMALSEFHGNDRAHRYPRVRIVGFAERIFTIPLNPVATAEGLAEFSFGTLVQRSLSLCGVRLHYGHPDMIEGSFAKFHGGMSLASAKINLSEDIFEGFKAVLHGYKSEHVEYLMMGKARETNLPGATKFNAKIAMGAGCGVNRSPEALEMVLKVDVWRAAVNYLATIGWYDFQAAAIWSTVLLTVSLMIIGLQKEASKLNSLTSTDGALAASFVQLAIGMLPVLIGLFELLLRYGLTGFVEALKTTLLGFADYVFQSLTRHSSFVRAILKRKAVYIATGRSLGFQKQDPISLVTSYIHTHIFPSLSILEYLIMFQILAQIDGQSTQNISNIPIIYIVFLVVLIAPSLYNPDQTTDSFQEDYKQVLPKYLQVMHTSAKRKHWREKGFDAELTELAKKSFRNTFFTDFLFYQDTWENHLYGWLLLSLIKAMLLVAMAMSSSVNSSFLALLFTLWGFFGAFYFCYLAQVRRVSLFVAGDTGMLGGAAGVGCVVLMVFIGIGNVGTVTFFDVAAGFWLVSAILRQALNVCMCITSVLLYRPALTTARMTGNKEKLYETLSLQQEAFWPLYQLLLIDVTRVIAAIFIYCTSVGGSLLSSLMWKFYLRTSRVRYVDRAKDGSDRNLGKQGSQINIGKKGSSRDENAGPVKEDAPRSPNLTRRLKNIAGSIWRVQDPEAPTSPLSPRKPNNVHLP